MSEVLDLVIVGGGPCGLAASISAQRAGLRTVVLEGASVVSTIAHYPTYVRFFSTAEKLSLGDMPFVGRLFRSESTQSKKTSLVIFVTPTIIDPAGNRVHSEEDLPFAQTSIPKQTQPITP